MQKIKTGDGSYTFLNDAYGEAYHSVSGAEEEAVKKYAEPTKLAELARHKDEIYILDVCFGIGYNSAAAIDTILKANRKCRVNILGLEIDDKLFDKLQDLDPGFESYHVIKKLRDGNYDDGQIKVRLLFGDARETIKKVQPGFHVCFLDPFSPAKLPELWTEEFFKDISSKLEKGAVLATYSCATHVRINLVRAGFDVKDGPSIGRRAPSTIAVKVDDFMPL